VDPDNPGEVISTSLALDSSDRPNIAYADLDVSGSLRYARWTGSSWALETVDSSPDIVDCSLALDSQDHPHICYLLFSGGLFSKNIDAVDTVQATLKYAHWTGSAWEIQIVDQETATAADMTVFDQKMNVLNQKMDVLNQKMDSLNGEFTAPQFPFYGGKFSSIAIDSNDLPDISYGSLIPVSTTSLHYAHLVPPDTATVNTATGTGTATFHTSAGGIASLTAASSTQCGILSGFTFPHGFFSFTVTDITPGSTVTITIALPSNMPTDTQYWKCINGQWVNATSILGDNDGDNILTLTITDGSQFDADGEVNGTIMDPGGPAVFEVLAPTHPIVLVQPNVSPQLPRLLNPPQMSLQYLNISPQQASASQPVTIMTNVVNTGDSAGNLNVALKINGQVEESRMVSVGPMASQPVKFTVTRDQPGTYTVDIVDKSGSFIIVGDSSSSGAAGSKTGALIALALIGVLIVATVVVLLFRRT
jgi:hypothetical protein